MFKGGLLNNISFIFNIKYLLHTSIYTIRSIFRHDWWYLAFSVFVCLETFCSYVLGLLLLLLLIIIIIITCPYRIVLVRPNRIVWINKLDNISHCIKFCLGKQRHSFMVKNNPRGLSSYDT